MSNDGENLYEGLIYECADGICTITLNRPERLNAIDQGPGGLFEELTDALMRANADDAVRCIVVTGAGRAFSSGGSIRGALPETALEWYQFAHGKSRESAFLRETGKPVIAAINGMCLGAAMIMVCNFDFLIAVDTAEFGFIEMRFGDPATGMLAYLIGPQWAKFLAISGELITAKKAKEIGLVLEVFPQEIFMPKVCDLARRIAAIPPTAVAMQKLLVNRAMENMGWRNHVDHEHALNAILVSYGHANHRTPDGRLLSDLRLKSWSEFKEARDAPFRPPWIDRSEADT